MLLIEKFERGDDPQFGRPAKTIDTLLSKVFLFGDIAIKVYKHKEAFYGNLADDAFRKHFIEEDFFWNHAMSQEIYLKLHEVENDYFIEMKQIDDTKTLTNLLDEKKVSSPQIAALTRTMTEKLRDLTRSRKDVLKSLFAEPWLDLHLRDLEDLRDWAYMTENIPRKETDGIIELLIEKSRNDAYFTQYNQELLSVAIDNNADNVLFLDGKPSFIDIMPPKENWKVADEFFTIARTAVDAYVLGGTELGDAVYSTYREFRADPSPTAKIIYEIRTALIQWAYREILKQPKRAKKYKEFTLKKVTELKTLV